MQVFALQQEKVTEIGLTDVRGETALCLGSFDGVHTGHASLIRQTVTGAKKADLLPAVFCIDFPAGKDGEGLLCSREERLQLLFGMGVSYVFLAEFADLADLSPERFVSSVLVPLCHGKAAFCGENFRFGRSAAGDAACLQRLLPGGVVPLYYQDGEKVSSTAIRTALAEGQTEKATAMLGRLYQLSGTVISGKALGRTLGYPTANLNWPEQLFCPRHGVYVAEAIPENGKCYRAVTNIGVRPTVEITGQVNCESTLLGYSGDLYGQKLTVRFLHFLRPEKHFPDVQSLQKQLDKDKKEAEKWDRTSTIN